MRSRSDVSLYSGANQRTDVLSGGRGVETLGTFKHRSPSGCDHRSTPTNFGLDVRGGFDRIHHEPPGRRQTESRAYAFHRVVRRTYLLTSYQVSPKASVTFTPAT